MKVMPLILIALIGSGCGTYIVNYDIDAPSLNELRNYGVQELPLSIGVYYPPATRNYRYLYYKYRDYDMHIGDMSVRFWNEVFPHTFNKVVLLEQHPLNLPLGDLQLDAIIEVRIDFFQYEGGGSKAGFITPAPDVPSSAGIGIAFVLRCPNGERIAVQHVLGSWRSMQSMRKVIESAFMVAMNKFLRSSLLTQLETIECPDLALGRLFS